MTLAHAQSGQGPPLVKAANWLSHLDHDWDSPVWRHWLVGLSRRHELIRTTSAVSDRIGRLVLYGGYAQGRSVRARSEQGSRDQELLVEMVRLGWGHDQPAFRQVFTSLFMPDGSRELWDAFNDLQRKTTSPTTLPGWPSSPATST